MDSHHLTILHLSDLQFGENHRYPDGVESFNSLYSKLAQDLDELKERSGIQPTAIVVTGDVAELSMPAEYEQAARFLSRLAVHLKVDRKRVVVVPGNHDVNWSLCQGARLTAEGEGRAFEQPYFAKFNNYRRFVDQFYKNTGVVFDENNLFHVYALPKEQVLIVGFNSCIHESERDDDHYGWIGVQQALDAVQRCDELDPERECLRIGALHHNFVGGSDLDNENLRDRDEIVQCLQKGLVQLLLHGHRHIAGLHTWGRGADEPLKILATGSAGLDRKTLPDHPNQYQIVTIENRSKVTVTMRQYSAQSFGLKGQGTWIADASVDDSSVVRFSLGTPQPKHEAKVKPAAAYSSLTDARKQLADYLAQEHRYLQLKGFGTSLRAPLELERLYIALHAVPGYLEEQKARALLLAAGKPEDFGGIGKSATGGEPTPAASFDELEVGPALEFCEQQNYSGMVILGDPGCGKTTLLKFLTLCLVNRKPQEQTGVPPRRFPILLPLRYVEDFGSSLEAALREYYANAMTHLNLPSDFFQRVLKDHRRPCLLMLDGLDEVTTVERREKASEWIESQRKAYRYLLIVVTSRFAGYRGSSRLPGNYLELHIRDFHDDDVFEFVRLWYHQVETAQRGDELQWQELARNQSENLIQQLNSSSSLLTLARNPLMLQIICLVHRSHGQLPRRRTELYEECVKVLLQKWDEAKGLEVFLNDAEARHVFRPLALWLHEEENRTHADAEQVKAVIAPHLARVKRKSPEWANEHLDRVLTSVRDRSGLFVGYGVERYGFQHLSFQEFLAAEEIIKQRLHSLLVDRFGQSWWREPTLLALGIDDQQFQASLFAELIRAPACQKHMDLALTCMRETLIPNITPMVEALRDHDLPRETRHNCVLFLREIGGAEAENALRGALDDPESQVANAALEALLRLERPVPEAALPDDVIINEKDKTVLIRIPGGKFWMGTDDGPEEERPRHQVHLDEYYIARNPITNAQYAKFIEETGHPQPAFWKETRFNQPYQPVVGVYWYDAMEYCEWAGLQLPTEAQWEKAARGTDDRIWPWGDEAPDERRCNFNQNIGATREVGSYPDGASWYDCLDMAGNVREWCVTKWRDSYLEDEPDDSSEGDLEARVLRGGCWQDDDSCIRCAYRFAHLPGLPGFPQRGISFRPVKVADSDSDC